MAFASAHFVASTAALKNCSWISSFAGSTCALLFLRLQRVRAPWRMTLLTSSPALGGLVGGRLAGYRAGHYGPRRYQAYR